ncbi:hypothetical protein ACH5RR_004089 [Cinchona calisaya]|uniref:PRA1 family protein n=1 Tax=Cinchona calisaya TaxID=153742 RepID=A0ABD3AWM7_9GENT
MTTMYGTIPTSDFHADVQLNRIRSSDLGKRRPWKEMLSSFSFPDGFKPSLSRISTNAAYFHMNYAMIVLFLLFLSLLWHPVSLIVFIVMMVAWLFLYFLRDDPIVICGYAVDERVVLTLLSISTVVVLVVRATVNVVAGVSVGIAMVVVHGAFRMTDDLNVYETRGVEGPTSLDLMESAAVSFSSSYE